MRWKPAPPAQNAAPQFDGPGSFGELHETVTLDCLAYAGSISRDGIEHVLIRDETGRIHVLKPGSYMGENSGVIARIDADVIHIRQLLKRNGRVEEVSVRFPKQKAGPR